MVPRREEACAELREAAGEDSRLDMEPSGSERTHTLFSGRDPALGPLGAVGKLRMMPMKPQGSSHKAGNPPWVQRASAEGKAGETVMRREAWPTALQGLSCPGVATHLCGASLTQGLSMAPEGTLSSPASPSGLPFSSSQYPPPLSRDLVSAPTAGSLSLPPTLSSQMRHPDHRAAPSRGHSCDDRRCPITAPSSTAVMGHVGLLGTRDATSVTEELNF